MSNISVTLKTKQKIHVTVEYSSCDYTIQDNLLEAIGDLRFDYGTQVLKNNGMVWNDSNEKKLTPSCKPKHAFNTEMGILDFTFMIWNKI